MGMLQEGVFAFSILYKCLSPLVHSSKFYLSLKKDWWNLCWLFFFLNDEWILFSTVFYEQDVTLFNFLLHMQQPNDEDPLNHDAAAVLRDNPKLFESNVRRAMAGGYVGQIYFPRCVW